MSWLIMVQLGTILVSLISERPAMRPLTVQAPLAGAGVFVDLISFTSIAQGMSRMVRDAGLPGTLDRSWGVRTLNEYMQEEVAGRFESRLENAQQEQAR